MGLTNEVDRAVYGPLFDDLAFLKNAVWTIANWDSFTARTYGFQGVQEYAQSVLDDLERARNTRSQQKETDG